MKRRKGITRSPDGLILFATANAVVSNGFVIDATITDGGFGNTNVPTVRIFEGGGSGAKAVAVVSDGIVSAIHILDAGFGYTSHPGHRHRAAVY